MNDLLNSLMDELRAAKAEVMEARTKVLRIETMIAEVRVEDRKRLEDLIGDMLVYGNDTSGMCALSHGYGSDRDGRALRNRVFEALSDAEVARVKNEMGL